jgi:hypothetical protein
MKGKTNLALCLLLLSFCGLLGTKGVPKEQVNADLGDRTISIKGANGAEEQWNFKDDSYRCFAPSDTPRLGTGEDTSVLFGEIVLHYKKDNGKWVLDSIEPKDVRTSVLTGDAFSKYLDLQKPLCNYFKYRSEK